MHRPSRPLLALGSTALLIVSLLASAGGASAAATSATTGTFRQTAPITLYNDGSSGFLGSNGTDVVLSDGPAAPSTITVAAPADASLTDVYVSITLAHENLADVDLMLVAPSGQAVTLMSDIGGPAFSGTIRLPPQWKWPLPDNVSACPLLRCHGLPRDVDGDPGDNDVFPAAAPASAPSSYSALGGASVAGDWTLYAVDDTAGQSGVIDEWTLLADYGLPASPSPSSLDIADAQRSLADVDLCFDDLDIPSLLKVDVVLESPGGRRAHVLGDALWTLYDASGARVRQVCLDDEAALDVPHSAFPTAASYRPRSYNTDRHHEFVAGFDAAPLGSRLSVFDGTDPNGTWRLWVHNSGRRTQGTIGGWSLRITSTTPASTTPAPATPAPAPTTTMTSSPPAPKVLAFRPKNAQGGVRTSVSPRVVFSTDLMPASVTSESINLRTVYGRKVPVALTYDAATHTVVLDPKHDLDHRARYTVTVKTGIRDAAGTRLSRVRTATFRTRWPAPAGALLKTKTFV